MNGVSKTSLNSFDCLTFVCTCLSLGTRLLRRPSMNAGWSNHVYVIIDSPLWIHAHLGFLFSEMLTGVYIVFVGYCRSSCILKYLHTSGTFYTQTLHTCTCITVYTFQYVINSNCYKSMIHRSRQKFPMKADRQSADPGSVSKLHIKL